MRRLIAPATMLFLAACAGAPQPPPQAPAPPPEPVERGDLIGLTSGQLIQRFGTPVLQVREGIGLKLQFRGPQCVLDAYLYPPANARGGERVTHVDARLVSGADTDQRACIATLNPSSI